MPSVGGNRERGQEKHNRFGMTKKVLPVLCTNLHGWPAGKGNVGPCSQLGNYMCSNTPEHSVWQPTAGEMKLFLCLVLLHLFFISSNIAFYVTSIHGPVA